MFSLQQLLMTKPNTKSTLGSRVDQIINPHSAAGTSLTDPLSAHLPAQPPSGETSRRRGDRGPPRPLTCRGCAWPGAGALHLSAVLVHTPAEVTLPVALHGDEVAQVITLRHVLVVPGCATVVLQQAFPPALTDGLGPPGGC